MMRAIFSRLLVGCLLALAAGCASAAGAGSVKLYGTDYVSASHIANQTGLAKAWMVPQKKLVLKGKTTRLELEAGSRDFELDGMRVFLGEPAVAHRSSIYISQIDRDRFLLPILDPRRIPGPRPKLKTIVIDPGHGGKDNGAQNTRLRLKEKSMALDVALRLERILKQAGYRVVLTRRKDTFIPLPLRPARARKEKADLFISIHFNAMENKKVAGTETYILTPQYQRSTSSSRPTSADKVRHSGNGEDVWNAVLGYRMHSSLVRALKSDDRGLKRARFAVLRDLDCPGLLVEGGYLSNDAEARKIGTAKWRQELAVAIASGVQQYRDALR